VNYLARLGWSLDGETEIFSREDLVNKFSIFRVQKAPAGFDPGKLLWLNGEYMKGLENKAEVVASYLEKLPCLN
jgi:nondiscriminating glutamyl-tRNA synthetase